METREYELMDQVEGRMWWYRGAHANVAQLLRGVLPRSGAVVLDAGCGTGGLLARLACALPGATLCGVEIDEGAARRAAAKSRGLVVAGSLNALPFRDGAFDGMASLDVLCHGKVDEAAALAGLRRCLKPGGHLVLSLPAYRWLLSAHDARVHNVRRYTAAGVRRLLAAAGFRTVRIGYWNGFLLPLMVARRKLMRADEASDVQAFPPWLDRLFGGVLALERGLRGLGLWLPCGGSVLALAVKDDG